MLTHKYYDGKTPLAMALSEKERELVDEVYSYPKKIGESIEKFKFREAVSTMIDLARLGNKYLAEQEPWKVIKDNPERVKTIIFVSLHLSSILAVVAEPFLPFTSQKIKNILNYKNHNIDWSWKNLKQKQFIVSFLPKRGGRNAERNFHLLNVLSRN